MNHKSPFKKMELSVIVNHW